MEELLLYFNVSEYKCRFSLKDFKIMVFILILCL